MLLLCSKSYAQDTDDTISIDRISNDFYIKYKYKNSSQVVMLAYPFIDSVVLVNGILYSHNNMKARLVSKVVVDNLLIICLADFSYSGKKMVFIIDKSKNEIVDIKNREELYMETGLPYFVFLNNVFITSNILSFIDKPKERVLLHHYLIKNNTVQFIESKYSYISEYQVKDKYFFKNYNKVLRNVR